MEVNVLEESLTDNKNIRKESPRRALTLIDDDLYAYRGDNYEWGEIKKDEEDHITDFHNMKINDVLDTDLKTVALSNKAKTDETCTKDPENSTEPIVEGINDNTTIDSPNYAELSELNHMESKTDPMRRDSRTLKSLTLGRMGKIFKSRPATPNLNQNSTDSKEERTKKEKTNSLGRMLKLVDKDGTPKKLFPHTRGGSLGRILRRQNPNKNEGSKREVDGKIGEISPSKGVFSRMINHLKGRPASGQLTMVEPNIRSMHQVNSSSSIKGGEQLNPQTFNDIPASSQN